MRASHISGFGDIHDFRPSQHRRKRQAGTDTFAATDQICINSIVFIAEPFSRTPETGLYFIDNYQDLIVVAPFTQSRCKIVGEKYRASHSLIPFKHKSANTGWISPC